MRAGMASIAPVKLELGWQEHERVIDDFAADFAADEADANHQLRAVTFTQGL